MYRKTAGVIATVLCLIPGYSFSQSVGWATQNGGTTGGEGGEVVTVTTVEELNSKISSPGKRIIKVQGKIVGDINIQREQSYDKTIEGAGPGAEINGFIYIRETKNIIVRNLIIKQVSSSSGSTDVIEVTMASNIWIDHCDISDTRTNTDGMCDIVRGSNYVTVSWCKFSYPSTTSTHRLAMLIGNKPDNGAVDGGKLQVTVHHNWFGDNIQERMPRIRYGKIHVFNNYYSPKSNNYCVGAGQDAQAVVESNYFEGVQNPHIFHEGVKTAQIRINSDNQYVNASGTKDVGQGNSFSIPYSYSLTPGKDVKSVVMKGCGPFGSTTHIAPESTRQLSISLQKDTDGNVYTLSGAVISRKHHIQPVIASGNTTVRLLPLSSGKR